MSQEYSKAITVEVPTDNFQALYQRFSEVIGEEHWQSRATKLRMEIRGNGFLTGLLQEENSVCFQLNRVAELLAKHGTLSQIDIQDRPIYPVMGFVAQLLSMIDMMPRVMSERFRRRVHGAFRNPEDMRSLRFELAVATHFIHQGHKIAWPEMEGLGSFDILVESLGCSGLEIECKSISEDKGRRIHRRDALNFYNLVYPRLHAIQMRLTVGLSIVLTVPGRLPTQYRALQALANAVCDQILIGRSAKLDQGVDFRLSEFNAAKLDHLANDRSPGTVRAAIDEVTCTRNREGLVIGSRSGGAIVLVMKSAADDLLINAIFDSFKTAARTQVTGTRPAFLLAELHSLDGEQLLGIGTEQSDPLKQPIPLRLKANDFLLDASRDHIACVGFFSRSEIKRTVREIVESGGTTYLFHNPRWGNQFRGLFPV